MSQSLLIRKMINLLEGLSPEEDFTKKIIPELTEVMQDHLAIRKVKSDIEDNMIKITFVEEDDLTYNSPSLEKELSYIAKKYNSKLIKIETDSNPEEGGHTILYFERPNLANTMSNQDKIEHFVTWVENREEDIGPFVLSLTYINDSKNMNGEFLEKYKNLIIHAIGQCAGQKGSTPIFGATSGYRLGQLIQNGTVSFRKVVLEALNHNLDWKPELDRHMDVILHDLQSKKIFFALLKKWKELSEEEQFGVSEILGKKKWFESLFTSGLWKNYKS